MKTRWWIGTVAGLSVAHAASAQEDLQAMAGLLSAYAAAAPQDPDGVAALRRAIAQLEGKGPLRAEDRAAVEREMERLARLLHGSKPEADDQAARRWGEELAHRMTEEKVRKIMTEQMARAEDQVVRALARARLELDDRYERALDLQAAAQHAIENLRRLGVSLESSESVGELRTEEQRSPRRGSRIGATVAPPAPPAPAAPPAVTMPLLEPPPAPLPPSAGPPTKMLIGTPAPPAAGSSPGDAELRAMLQELRQEMAEVRRLIDAVRSRTGR